MTNQDFGKPEWLGELPPFTDEDRAAMDAEMLLWHELEESREADRREAAEEARELQYQYEMWGHAARAPLCQD